MPYETWLKAQAPTYMQDQYGQAWLGGIGAAMDDYAQQYIAGTKATFPDYAPPDALGVIGDELGIDRGPFETDQQYAARLVGAWLAWKFAGTPLGLLVALYWAGFGGGVLVQQNGLAYSLTGSPVAGADPTSLLSVTNCSQLAVGITSSVTTSRVVPAGNQWWSTDPNTDFCSRFAILYPNGLPSFFMTSGVATFTGIEDGSTLHPWPLATWNNPFVDTTYKIQPGAVTILNGLGPVSVAADNTSKTTTGVRIAASDSFVGSVDVLAWQAGANPYADLHPNDLQRLQNAIRKWRPAKAYLLGVFCLVQGNFYGWPIATIGTRPAPGPSSIVQFLQGA